MGERGDRNGRDRDERDRDERDRGGRGKGEDDRRGQGHGHGHGGDQGGGRSGSDAGATVASGAKPRSAPKRPPRSPRALGGTPTGPIRTPNPWDGGPFGGDWSNVNRWDALIEAAAREFGVDPHLAKAMMVVETQGTWAVRPDDGWGGGETVGLMQVKPQIWGELGAAIGADPYTEEGNIRLGTKIMADAIAEHGSWEAALTTVYFPGPDPKGTTQNSYVKAVKGLMAEMRSAAR